MDHIRDQAVITNGASESVHPSRNCPEEKTVLRKESVLLKEPIVLILFSQRRDI